MRVSPISDIHCTQIKTNGTEARLEITVYCSNKSVLLKKQTARSIIYEASSSIVTFHGQDVFGHLNAKTWGPEK